MLDSRLDNLSVVADLRFIWSCVPCPQETTSKGYTFSLPYLINGLTIVGQPEYLSCVNSTNSTWETNFTEAEFCSAATICVRDETTHEAVIAKLLENSVVEPRTSRTDDDYYEGFVGGDCNLLAGEQFDVAEPVLRNKGYDGEYEVMGSVLTKELISMVTRDGDSRFSDFVNHVLQSFITTEELGLSSGDVASRLARLNTGDIFGSRYETMFQDVFHVVGDSYNGKYGYGALYEKHLESLVPRSQSAANHINFGNTSSLYTIPLGNLESQTSDSPYLKSSTIETIVKRGRLVVGISDDPLFARLVDGKYYRGIDVDFARAISAALFDGASTKVQFIVVSAAERFQKLLNGDVDVLARVTTNTMERDVKEPTTRTGFTFSSTMFLDSVRMVGKET